MLRTPLIITAGMCVISLLASPGCAPSAQPPADKELPRRDVQPIEPDAVSELSTDNVKVARATFAAGCFWGVEAGFRQIEGVLRTTVGYTGGHRERPSYHEVCTTDTGHAEAVLVEFDPQQVSYERLLEHFWQSHDPTQSNRQGFDVGAQYRSAIFYRTPQQHAAAEASKRRLAESGRRRGPIVTQILPATSFWPAEEYHQQYYEKSRRMRPRCATTLRDQPPLPPSSRRR